jgi:two-component system response regulator PilR (NtrC family)
MEPVDKLLKVLIVDDEVSQRTGLAGMVNAWGMSADTASEGGEALEKVASFSPDVIVTDLNMPGMDGYQFLEKLQEMGADAPPSIVLTAFGSIETGVRTVHELGAFWFLEKPVQSNVLQMLLRRAAAHNSLRTTNRILERQLLYKGSLGEMVGTSGRMQEIFVLLQQAGPTNACVLISGESGTGKELVARAVHACSPRESEPFVSINCGAFPETLLESELFGYMKGAFTGASQNKRGLFEVASGGTIFLDEISEMSVSMQVKLLRVLQERSIRPVGGTQETPIDVRVIAATNKDLRQMVAANTFREDLYYRVSVIPVQVPPLRDRREDVELLASHFLKKYANAAQKSIVRIRQESLETLRDFDWPGNVRQLENTVERAVAMETSDVLKVDLEADHPSARTVSAAGNGHHANVPSDGMDFEKYVADIERSLIESALQQSGGVQTRAAELLKVSYRSFRHLLKKYDI